MQIGFYAFLAREQYQSWLEIYFINMQGLFEVLSLKGLLSSGAGVPFAGQRPNFFSVLLAKPDGRVFGGCLAGPLVAAGPVQVSSTTFSLFSDAY